MGFKGRLHYNNSFKLFKKKIPLNYLLTFDAQISHDKLFGSEQFGVGGLYSVRGFKDEYLLGDSGFYIKNDLTLRLKDLHPSLNKELIKGISITPFYDYGMVRNKGGGNKGYLSGTGAKLSFSDKELRADLTYSRSINSPARIKEDEAVYFTVKLRL